MPTLIDFSSAIASMEGAQPQLNNPGNIRNWSSSLPTDSRGITIFGSLADGLSALNQQIQKNINRGLNLYEFFGGKPGVYGGYAPSADSNNPTAYAQYVAGRLGIDPNTPLNQVSWNGVTQSIDTSGYPVETTTDVDTSSIFDGSDPLVIGIVIIVLGGIFFFSK